METPDTSRKPLWMWGEGGSRALLSGIWGKGGSSGRGLTVPLCSSSPPQAVAIVCGFLLVILLCVICFFAHKTRQKIWQFGKQNIYWDRPPAMEEGPNVEEWVSGAVETPPPKAWGKQL